MLFYQRFSLSLEFADALELALLQYFKNFVGKRDCRA